MSDDPVALSLHADVRADLAGTGIGLGRGASKLDGICAGQVGLGLTCRWRAHDHSFCRIPVTARAQTDRLTTQRAAVPALVLRSRLHGRMAAAKVTVPGVP